LGVDNAPEAPYAEKAPAIGRGAAKTGKGLQGMDTVLYIASQDRDGGILQCALTETGELKQHNAYPADRPAYLCIDGDTLYAVLREPFQMQSGVISFRIMPDGSLSGQSAPRPVHGTISAHILAKDGRVYCANYLSGSTTLLPDRILAHSGSGPHPTRQDCSHPHCVTPTPDQRYLCINDLGTDCIYVCTEGLEEVSRVRLPAGSGPRHLVFSGDGRFAYCSNELASSVSVLAYSEGRLRYLRTYPSLPAGFGGENAASAIRLNSDSSRLYVSNRGHDSVAEYAVEEGRLTLLRHIPSGGSSPREINLVGGWLLCANENSDNVCVFSLAGGCGGEPVSTLAVKRPWCIAPARRPSRPLPSR